MHRVPGGFVPGEDQGYFLGSVILPDAASLNRTEADGQKRAEAHRRQMPGVDGTVIISGYNILTGTVQSERRPVRRRAQALGTSAQRRPSRSAPSWRPLQGIMRRRRCARPSCSFSIRRRSPAWAAPAASPSSCRTGRRHARRSWPRWRRSFTDGRTQAARDRQRLLASSTRARRPSAWTSTARRPRSSACRSTTSPWRCRPSWAASTSTTSRRFGRTFKVIDAGRARVPQRHQATWPAARAQRRRRRWSRCRTLVTPAPISAPTMLQRYNLYRTAEIGGDAAPGYSSGDAIARHGGGGARGAARQATATSGRASACRRRPRPARRRCIFGLALVFVFLFLAALYESWSVPFAVLFAVPLGVFGAHGGPVAHGPDEQHLRPDRPHPADRPGGQERHPDRRVRQDEARRGHGRGRAPRWRPPSCACGRSS